MILNWTVLNVCPSRPLLCTAHRPSAPSLQVTATTQTRQVTAPTSDPQNRNSQLHNPCGRASAQCGSVRFDFVNQGPNRLQNLLRSPRMLLDLCHCSLGFFLVGKRERRKFQIKREPRMELQNPSPKISLQNLANRPAARLFQ
jgi:hypothetical protein